MAVPSYTEDLTDIDLAEATTNYVQINHAGGGGGTLGVGPDFSMQGTNCVDRQVTNNNRGIAFNNGSGINVTGTDIHVFQWLFVATPGLTDTLQNEGAVVMAGNATGQLVRFHVEGNDTYGAGGRVARCYPYRYVLTASVVPPYRTLTGTPSGNPQYFGSSINTTGTVKGANLGNDAARYGTGAYLTAGELISAGDASDDPCTFDGFSTQNDSISNRWGILTKVGQTFELQGKFVIGQNNSQVTTLARFEDSDVSIFFPDTPHSLTDFTQIIVDHASTVVNLTNLFLQALGTNNPGKFVVNNVSTVVNLTGGAWTGIGQTSFEAATVADGLTWRLADNITCNGATLDNCLVDRCIAASAVLTDNLNDLTLNSFVGDGTGHAVELSSIGAGSMNWNNFFDTSTYATVDGSTGNETIYVNVGSGNLIINVTAGATTPTIRTAGAVVTVVAGAVEVKITVESQEDNLAIQGAAVLARADSVGPLPFEDSVTITRTGAIATVAHTAHGLSTNQWVEIEGAVQNDYNRLRQVTVNNANEYTYSVRNSPTTPATGSITATAVIINGLTDSLGEITDTRTYSADQEMIYSVRKGSGVPVFVGQDLSGTLDKDLGFSSTVSLIPD